jgi:hypothetical protein
MSSNEVLRNPPEVAHEGDLPRDWFSVRDLGVLSLFGAGTHDPDAQRAKQRSDRRQYDTNIQLVEREWREPLLADGHHKPV